MALAGGEIVNLVLGLVSYALLGVYVLVFHVALRPFHRDFFCNDESIGYPYKPDTISMSMMVAISFALVLGTVLGLEAVRHCRRMNRATREDKDYVNCLPCDARVTATLANVARGILLAGFGAIVNEVLTVTVKTILGRHRPHFLEICRPNATDPMYAGPCSAHAAIPVAVCRPNDAKLFRESMLSFPSGHSSHGMFAATFCVLYLQSRFTFSRGHAVKWFLQALCLAWGFGVCASRVSDYKHHWSDALAGGMLGAFVAATVGLRLRPGFCNCQLVAVQRPEDDAEAVAVVTRDPDRAASEGSRLIGIAERTNVADTEET